jgi:tRNA(fMet)-specific endonuclease VapC
MTRYLLDSGILGDYASRKFGISERVRAEKLRGNVVGTCTPVLGEVLSGLERSATRDRNMQRLWVALPSLMLWSFDHVAASEYGRLDAELHRIGRLMQPIDVMAAAVARVLGNCVVVTVDGDLSAVPGLKVENWRVPPPTPTQPGG